MANLENNEPENDAVDSRQSQSVLDLTAEESRDFFLKHESYCTIDLPPYFRFESLLKKIDEALGDQKLNGLIDKPCDYEGVNHTLLSNKDGRHAWRPLELIHPALYVSLVRRMTEACQWDCILKRFEKFQNNSQIQCLSIPVRSSGKDSDKAVQISQWWRDFEQSSIELSLEYGYVAHADITDCYGAIYTHSISWAIHTKEQAKQKRSDSDLIGNTIDRHIQNMRHGQTNGIPQGSVLMDFVAEMVLGYADTILYEKVESHNIGNYKILRYRDDYRIFVNNSWDADCILKCLTETMIGLGLKLSSAKTSISDQVVRSSIKDDKLAWLCHRKSDKGLQKHLLLIHSHATNYPNAGSLIAALRSYYARIQKAETVQSPRVLISMVADIAYRSPKTYSICAAILSKLINCLSGVPEKREIVGKIKAKFKQLPNTNHMEIWLQRISHPLDFLTDYDESLCKLLTPEAESSPIWVNDWIKAKALKNAVDEKLIVHEESLAGIAPVIPMDEVDLFGYESA